MGERKVFEGGLAGLFRVVSVESDKRESDGRLSLIFFRLGIFQRKIKPSIQKRNIT